MELLKEANGNISRTKEEKEKMIEEGAFFFGKFLNAIGFDYEADENSKGTPLRVSKSWVNELVVGTNSPMPKISQFPNGGYTGIVFQGNIKVVSQCSHHALSFSGVCHLAYVPKAGGKVIGLSKLNRLVDWISRRPQIQEGLTKQIHDTLDKLVDNEGIACIVECNHTCCSNRGIGHDSTMKTALMSGHFFTNEIGTKDEFYQMISTLK